VTVYLFRVRVSSLCTIGIMIAGSSIYWTLEPPWRNNRRNVSCIPKGEYDCVYLPRSASGKYRNVYHVTGVQGRSGILIHNGNLPNHTLGCILLGKRTGKLSGSTAVLNSRTAMTEFVRNMNKQSFKLKVTQWG
jgi:hypothetical protein